MRRVEFYSPLTKTNNDDRDQACFFLANEVFKNCKHIKEFVFHENVLFHNAFGEFRNLDSIVIDKPEVASVFWRQLLTESPQGFRLIDSKNFFDKELISSCLFFVEESFRKQLGGNDSLAEELTHTIFNYKLKIEEQKFGTDFKFEKPI